MKEVPVHNWCDVPELNADEEKCWKAECEWITSDIGHSSCAMPLINPCDTPDMHKDEALCLKNPECEFIWEVVHISLPYTSLCRVKFEEEPVHDHCAKLIAYEGNTLED
jgi:hypothetical protein